MKIICYGDSNTYGYDPRGMIGEQLDAPWPEILARKTGWTVINNGENGREIPQRAICFPEDTDLLILMLGTNNLLQLWTPEAAANAMKQFLQSLTLHRSKILLLAPPVMRLGAWVMDQELIEDSVSLSRLYRTLAMELGVSFADAGEWRPQMAFDGVHLTQEGHRVLADGLRMYITENIEIMEKQPIVDTVPCITVENMRASDAYTIAHFTPSLELMHRAALGIFRATQWDGRTAVVAGSGNNGGDGYALACILREQGFDCAVYTVGRKISADGAYYSEKAAAAGIPIGPFHKGCLDGFDRIVDCMLGTGFQGQVRDPYRSAIESVNASGAFVISADINSGMNGDTGEAELAVRSDLTVTIGYVKTGLVTENAGKYMKKLVCADIGIVLLRDEAFLGDEADGCIPCPSWLDKVPISVTAR